MSEIPVDKKFSVLCQISRAQHFAWRAAVQKLCPEVDPQKVVEAMWEETGLHTAGAYLKRLKIDEPLAEQVARSIQFSSDCMGETAAVEPGEGDEAFVRHTGCPWYDWHKRLDLLAEDRPGCDRWFQSTIDTVNNKLGTSLRFETLESLPEGGSCCLRRIWRADDPSVNSGDSDR